MKYETLVLIFIRTHCIRDFDLFGEALKALASWFYVLDQTYARWVPIHIRYMKALPQNIKEEVIQMWFLQMTQHESSCMPLDHGHEQDNVKRSGGVVELTENAAASRIWMVSGPQQARLLKEFEDQFMDGENVNIYKQHEQE